MEIRELLDKYDYNGQEAHFVKGSALAALGKVPDETTYTDK